MIFHLTLSFMKTSSHEFPRNFRTVSSAQQIHNDVTNFSSLCKIIIGYLGIYNMHYTFLLAVNLLINTIYNIIILCFVIQSKCIVFKHIYTSF